MSAPQKADALEVRLDHLGGAGLEALSALFDGAPRPLIATCRRASDGGAFRGSERRRIDLLYAAVKAGAAYVDVEHGSEAAASLCAVGREHPAVGVILSHHDLKGMP